jgi:hypothetical protein
MFPRVNGANSAGNLSADDIAGVQQLYGARAGTGTPPTPPTTPIDPATQVSVTDFATTASSLFFLKAVPTASEFAARSSFATTQYNYYASVLKVANPSVGTYEAFGAAFSALPAFRDQYGMGIDTSSFIDTAYQDVFHRAATNAQFSHFNDQMNYFRGIYGKAGLSFNESELKARGAVSGQMLGFAMTDATERQRPAQTLDDTVANYFKAAATAIVGLVGVDEHDHNHDHSFMLA